LSTSPSTSAAFVVGLIDYLPHLPLSINCLPRLPLLIGVA